MRTLRGVYVDSKEKKKKEKKKAQHQCLVEGARIKADSQRAWSVLGDHPERDGSRYRDIVSIFPPWPETHTHTHKHLHLHLHGAGCRKKQGNFRKETREIDSRGVGSSVWPRLYHSLPLSVCVEESCVEKSRADQAVVEELEKWK